VESYLKINEIKKGKIKPGRKDEKERIQFAYESWNEYKERYLNRVEYLKKISYKFQGFVL